MIGSLYFGIATATEAAGVGVLGALAIAAWSRTLTWKNFLDERLRRGAHELHDLLHPRRLDVPHRRDGLYRHPAAARLDGRRAGLHPGPRSSCALTILIIVMGCFIDGISIVVLTASVLMPVVEAAKIDPLWFGIYLIFVVEMGLVTPPGRLQPLRHPGPHQARPALHRLGGDALLPRHVRRGAAHLVVSADRHLAAGPDVRADEVASHRTYAAQAARAYAPGFHPSFSNNN